VKPTQSPESCELCDSDFGDRVRLSFARQRLMQTLGRSSRPSADVERVVAEGPRTVLGGRLRHGPLVDLHVPSREPPNLLFSRQAPGPELRSGVARRWRPAERRVVRA
jgi:hypothetical protein